MGGRRRDARERARWEWTREGARMEGRNARASSGTRERARRGVAAREIGATRMGRGNPEGWGNPGARVGERGLTNDARFSRAQPPW